MATADKLPQGKDVRQHGTSLIGSGMHCYIAAKGHMNKNGPTWSAAAAGLATNVTGVFSPSKSTFLQQHIYTPHTPVHGLQASHY